MASFAGSTQKRTWQMTEEQVAIRRAAVVAKRPPGAGLTLAEEAIVRRHHERRIVRFAARMGFPEKIPATAVSYFKRFYLDHSVLDFNPAVIALLSMYSATKVEETNMFSAEEIVARVDTILNGIDDPKQNPLGQAATQSVDGTATRVTVEMLLHEELDFYNILHFHLVCFHPFRSLIVLGDRLEKDAGLPALTHSLAQDYDVAAAEPYSKPPPPPPVTVLGTLLAHASRIALRRTLLTDMLFTHTPAVIACACVICAAEEIESRAKEATVDATERCLDAAVVFTCILRDLDPKMQGVIREAAAAVRDMKEGGLASDDDVRALEERRRVLCDPLKDPTSESFKKRQAEKEEEQELKRRRKMQENTARSKAKMDALMGFTP